MVDDRRVTVRLTVAEHRQLVQLASETGLSLSEAVRACIAARFRYEDLAEEMRAIRSDVQESRAVSLRSARQQADRVLEWLNEHVDQ